MVRVGPVFLLLSVLCYEAIFAQVAPGQGAAAPTNCSQLSHSCAQCLNSTLGCRYVWNTAGFYNSSLNGSCIPTAAFIARRNANLKTKTIFAFAILESEVGTQAGQYLIALGQRSARSFGADAVVCYDRHLCCCKKMPPPPLNNLTVIVLDVFSLQPILTATAGASCGKSASLGSGPVRSPGGDISFTRVPIDDVCNGNGSAPLYTYVNTTGPVNTGQGSSYTIRVYLMQMPCVYSVLVVDASTNQPIVSTTTPTVLFRGTNSSTSTQGTFQFGTFQNFLAATGRIDAGAVGYQSNFGAENCPPGGNVVVRIPLTPLPNGIRVTVYTVDFQSDPVLRQGATVTIGGTGTNYPAALTNANGEVSYTGSAAGSYTASGSFTGYTSVTDQAFPRPLLARNDFINTTIFLYQPGCTAVIRVVDNFGAPVAGARVLVRNATGFLVNVTTNATGWVPGAPLVLQPLSFGYNATASAFGYDPGFTPWVCSASGGNSNPNPVVVVLQKVNAFNLFAQEVIDSLLVPGFLQGWFIQVADSCNNYQIDVTASKNDIDGGGCYFFTQGDRITFFSRSANFSLRYIYREAFGFAFDENPATIPNRGDLDPRATPYQPWNTSQPNYTLPYTGTPYNLFFTPFETVSNNNGTSFLYEVFNNTNIPPPIATLRACAPGLGACSFAGGLERFRQNLINTKTTNSAVRSTGDLETSNFQTFSDNEAVSNSIVSFAIPDASNYTSWKASGFSPGNVYFRVDGFPWSGYAWNFAPNTLTNSGTNSFLQVTLPAYAIWPWRQIPIFVPVKQAHIWIMIHITLWSTDGKTQINFPFASNVGINSAGCAGGPSGLSSFSANSIVGESALVFPFFTPFGQTICRPRINLPTNLVEIALSGYYDRDFPTPDPTYIPGILSGNTIAGESTFNIAGIPWRLNPANRQANVSRIPLAKYTQTPITFDWGTSYPGEYRSDSQTYINFFFGAVLKAKK